MIESLLIPKQQLTYFSESDNCATVLEILEDQGLRCAPVLDATGQMYRGNIYRYHIYQYAYHHPDETLASIPVTRFLKNTARTIHIGDSFYHLFFALRDLPYIAVLNEQQTFIGAIQHSKFMNFCAEAWAMPKTGYILSIKTMGNIGELAKISKWVNRYCDILASTTIESTQYDTYGEVIMALPHTLDPVQLNQLLRLLEKKNYPVTSHRLK